MLKIKHTVIKHNIICVQKCCGKLKYSVKYYEI